MDKSSCIWRALKSNVKSLLLAPLFSMLLLMGVPGWAAPQGNNGSAVSHSIPVGEPDTVLIIDAGVQDGQQLLSGVADNVKVVKLRSDADGVRQIADALKNFRKLDSIQIVSHGAPGMLALGSTALTDANLDSYRSALQAWGGALKQGGGILLYGCNVARGKTGGRFIERIGSITGASVAASTDVTGSPVLGGDWLLEKQTGRIDASKAIAGLAMSGYGHLLPLPANGVQDVTGTMANGTPTLASFLPGFTFTNDSGFNIAGNFSGTNGIFFNNATAGASSTFTVNADGANLGSFDLTALSFANLSLTALYNFSITGYKAGGGTVTTSFSAIGLILAPGIYTNFTGITGFQVTYVSTSGADPSNIIFDSFTIANATAAAPGAPSGVTATAGAGQATVNFTAPASDGGAAIATYTATSNPGSLTGTCAGPAACAITVTGLTNGTAYTFTVTATNSTGTGPASAASDPVTPKLTQTITFNNPGAQDFGTAPTLTATSDSGLTVSFTSSTTGVCTITAGGALTFVTAGTCTINADQAGDSTHFAAPTVAQSFTVNAEVPGAPTIGTATAGNTQATVTFTAPASNGGAAITSYTATSNPGGLTGACASSPCTVTGLTNGTAYTFTVTATNSAGTGSASAASNSVIPAAAQTITFNNPGAQDFDTAPTLTATSDSGLTVSFTSSTTGVCTITAGGALTFVTAGTCTINADQAGNASFTAAPTVTRSFTVNPVVPGAPTIGTATAGNTTADVSFTAPASNGGAAITSYTATSNPGGLTGACASSPCTVTGLTNGTAYTFTVTATNSAGTGSASAASNSVTPAAGQTITFNNPGAQNFGTAPTLTATADSGLTVSFTSSTTGVCTVTAGGALTFVTPGTCTINADQAGNGSFLAAPTVTQSFSVAAVVPGAPTIGTATAGNAQASVAFTAPASNGGSAITGYTVTSNPGGFTGTGAASPIIVSGLANGTAYTFTVTATNSVGTGAASASSNSVTPMANVPGAPTGVTATAGNGQTTVNFTAPASDGGSAITTYTATASPGGQTGTCAGPAACAITVSGLTNGTAYTFTVTATNTTGTGAASAASTPVTPAAPQTITFNNPGAQNFGAAPTLTATASSGLTVAFTSSTSGVCTITSGGALTFVTTGTCTIDADQAGNGSFLAAPTVTQSFSVAAVVPGAPTIGTATAGNAQASVAFTAPASNGGSAITGYTVTSSPGGFTGTGAASPIIVSGLTNGTAYTFTVTATNAVGAGAASAASNSVTPVAGVPGVPTGVTATAGNGQAAVNFTAPASNGGAAITTYTATASPGGQTGTCAGPAACTITVSGLTNGTAYTFTVRATNSTGAGAASAASNSVTPVAGVPGAPTGVTAVAGNGQATVSFTAPASNGGAAIATYIATSNPGGLTGTCAGPAACAITVAGLTNGTAYTFTVTATNSTGTGAASAASAAVTPAAMPTAGAATMGYQLNTPVTLDLAPFISGTGVSVTVAPAHGTVTVSGTQVTYTPTANYFGADSFSYVSTNGVVTSAAAVVTVNFAGTRPDPLMDASVSGLVNNLTETSRRFSRAQVFNFHQRLESLQHSARLSGGSSRRFAEMERPMAVSGNGWGVAGSASQRNAWTDLVAPTNIPVSVEDSGVPAMFSNWLANSLVSTLTTSSITLNLATVTGGDKPVPANEGGINVWGAGNVRIGTKGQDGGANIDYSTDGISFGADRRFGEKMVVGAGVGYAHDKSTIGTDGTESSSNGYSLAVYGSYQYSPALYIDGVIGYGTLSVDSTRYVESVNDFARANRSGSQVFGSIASGYEYRDNNSLLSPYVRYDFAIDRLDAATETGADVAALSYAGQYNKTQHISLGLRGEMQRELKSGSMLPRARVEYQHHIEGASQATVSYADLAGSAYTMALPTINSNSMMIGVGSGFLLNNGVNLDFDFQWTQGSGADASRAVFFKVSKELYGD